MFSVLRPQLMYHLWDKARVHSVLFRCLLVNQKGNSTVPSNRQHEHHLVLIVPPRPKVNTVRLEPVVTGFYTKCASDALHPAPKKVEGGDLLRAPRKGQNSRAESRKVEDLLRARRPPVFPNLFVFQYTKNG